MTRSTLSSQTRSFPQQGRVHRPWVHLPVLFGLTLFVSALLLFLVQPMIAQMTLPLPGVIRPMVLVLQEQRDSADYHDRL